MSPLPPSARYAVVERYWLVDDGATLDVHDRATGERFSVRGAARDALCARRHDAPLLRAMSLADARVAALSRALATTEPAALTRAAVLRGGGYGTLFIELTSRCNERCTHCYSESSPARHDALAWDTLTAVLDDAAALGFQTVQLTGGDPLLHPAVVDAVAHARALGVPRVELFTNGLALTPALLDRLTPHRPSFAFSVYASDPALHDGVTGVPGSHARTLRAIARCLERGLPVRAGVTLFAHTAHEREPTREALRAIGLDDGAVRFSTSRAVGRGAAYDTAGAEQSHGFRDEAADGKACVTATGDVHPCIFAREVLLGSVYARRLRDVLCDDAPVRAPRALDGAVAVASARLACMECRERDALLRDASAPALVPLRRRS